MPATRFAIAAATLLLGCAPSMAVADDIDKFEARKAAHTEVVEKARQTLIDAFELTMSQAWTEKDLSGEQRVKLIDAVKREQEAFEKSGRIPFSPVMREHVLRYLAAINKSALGLARDYQRFIKKSQSDGDEALTKQLIAEQHALAFPVGTWECRGENFQRKFTWILYSDFTVNPSDDGNDAFPKGWSFLPDGGMLITNHAPGAPKGGFKDKCQLSQDGQLFEAKNQTGGVYTGRLKE
jgi:hypothetical protein